jgi:hypothetical protein
MDIPKVEGAAPVPKPEVAKGKPVAPKEKPQAPKEAKQSGPGARKTLEDIAAGKPVAEALAPQVEAAPLPDHEAMSPLLNEANSLLLELKDMRVLLSALATQAADTPMGNEMRADTLRMIANMSNENMAPESVVKLAALQKQIQDLNLPDANPANSQLLQTIQQYNESHPQTAVPAEITDKLASGAADSAQVTAQLLQSNTELAAQVWKGITGQEGFAGLNPTPDNILSLTQMEKTPENMAKMEAIFGTIKSAVSSVDRGADMLGKIGSTYMMGAMGIMFVTQIAQIEGAGSGGH